MNRSVSVVRRAVLTICLAVLASVHASAAGPADGASAAEWPADPNPTRLLIGPTARSLEQGKVYLDVFGISLPFVQVGLTDRVSIGVGAPLLFPGLTPGEVFWVTPKVQVFHGDRTDAAVGLLDMHADGDNAGIAYGVVTHGTPDAAVTLGIGYGYRGGVHVEGGAPLVMLSGEKRVNRRVKLITENYLARQSGLVNAGVRLMRERVSFDLALGAAFDHGDVVPVPVLRMAWKF